MTAPASAGNVSMKLAALRNDLRGLAHKCEKAQRRGLTPEPWVVEEIKRLRADIADLQRGQR